MNTKCTILQITRLSVICKYKANIVVRFTSNGNQTQDGGSFFSLFQITRYNYPKENSAKQHLYPIGCEKYYLWSYMYTYMYLVCSHGIEQRWFLLLYMSLNACPQQIKCVSSLREMNFYNLFS